MGSEIVNFGDNEDPRNILSLGNVACIQNQRGKTAPFEVAIAGHSSQGERGKFTEYAEAGADLLILETMSDLYEMQAAIAAAHQLCELAIVASMTFTMDDRTLLGDSHFGWCITTY